MSDRPKIVLFAAPETSAAVLYGLYDVGLTPRTFARRFQAASGHRSIDDVHALRLEGARERLEAGPAPVDDIGFAVGHEDPTFFRRLSKRVTGMTAAAYRRKYTALPGASGPG